ncbi:MAG: sigma factor-like helix-turn-helix DNA-binding protein [Beijerinckiaceae bacterium]
MTANASQDTEREDFAAALGRFARGLGAGVGERSGFRPAEACAEALAVPPRPGIVSRDAAYRVLVRRFLREAASAAIGRRLAAQGSGRRPAGRAGAAQMRAAVENSHTFEALRNLAPTERAALLLVAVERFSYAQAADFMELSEPEFVRALARAREAFAARLATSAGRPHLRLVG